MNNPARIRYDEGCLAAHALNVIGDRWALLVVRELMLTPKRFQKIRQGLPGITAAVLTQRLGQLAEAGIVTHDKDLGIYSLTQSGKDLLPMMQAMCRWGAQHPGHDPRRFISPTALMLSMSAMIRPSGQMGSAGFILSGDGFVQQIGSDGRVQISVTPDPQADFVVEGDANTVAWLIYGPDSAAEMHQQGRVTIRGDLVAAQAYIDQFALA